MGDFYSAVFLVIQRERREHASIVWTQKMGLMTQLSLGTQISCHDLK